MTARMWTLRSVASAAALAILAGGTLAQAPHTPAAQTAATVNGEPIPLEEVQAVMKMEGTPALEVPTAQQRQMEMEALEFLIDAHVMQQFLHKNGPPVDPKDVARQLTDLQTSLKTQGKTLEDFYKTSGLNEQKLRDNIVTRLQREAYAKAHLTDADVKRYYEENRDFFDQVNVQASHILLRVPPTATEAERQAARAKLQGLRQQIVDGKIDFAEAAKKYSQCPSASRGGDIGYFPRKFAVEEAFARAAFTLKIGEISDVVQSDYGLHLIKVVDRKKEGPPSDFEKIKDEVRETATAEMLEGLLAQQRKLSKIEVKLGTEPGPK